MKKITQYELDEFLERRRYGKRYSKSSDDTFLRGMNLSRLNLAFADLHGLDLSETMFDWANLCNAYLRDANLMYASMRGANLCQADMRGADLSLTNFQGANLYRADLKDSSNASGIPMACPESGGFIAYKKAYAKLNLTSAYVFGCPVIVELEIPKTARRCSATTEKCRCDRANVLKIYDLRHQEIKFVKAFSGYDRAFEYKPGEMVIVPDFDDDRWNECSTGIHFFMSFQEAVEY